MSRIFEALTKVENESRFTNQIPRGVAPIDIGSPESTIDDEVSRRANPAELPSKNGKSVEPKQRVKVADKNAPNPIETVKDESISVRVAPESRLVALTNPDSLGAEKFRALVTRLDDLSKQHKLKSFQVTSSVIDEGKTLVAGNVAITLATYSGAKTLLIEGDLRKPTLASLLGSRKLRGVTHWWSHPEQQLPPFVKRLNDMPLWFLPAGEASDRSSDILRSARFIRAFEQLASQFDWIVVDSTPMLPIVDVNLWSKVVDGTLLVVREGLTPVKALKRGLEALDHPKLIGVVVNEATEFDDVSYKSQYYGGSGVREKSAKTK